MVPKSQQKSLQKSQPGEKYRVFCMSPQSHRTMITPKAWTPVIISTYIFTSKHLKWSWLRAQAAQAGHVRYLVCCDAWWLRSKYIFFRTVITKITSASQQKLSKEFLIFLKSTLIYGEILKSTQLAKTSRKNANVLQLALTQCRQGFLHKNFKTLIYLYLPFLY